MLARRRSPGRHRDDRGSLACLRLQLSTHFVFRRRSVSSGRYVATAAGSGEGAMAL
jgi:hypothetical protein